MRFTALFHHVYRLDTLRRAYFGLNPKAAPGGEGEEKRIIKEAGLILDAAGIG
jgi:hypothetical protein